MFRTHEDSNWQSQSYWFVYSPNEPSLWWQTFNRCFQNIKPVLTNFEWTIIYYYNGHVIFLIIITLILRLMFTKSNKFSALRKIIAKTIISKKDVAIQNTHTYCWYKIINKFYKNDLWIGAEEILGVRHTIRKKTCFCWRWEELHEKYAEWKRRKGKYRGFSSPSLPLAALQRWKRYVWLIHETYLSVVDGKLGG